MEYIESLKYFKNRKTGRKMIPYGRQTIEEDDIQAVVDVLRSDYLTTGPKIAEFEKMVADYVGAKYAVAISNGTSALHAACFAAGIQPGDEVITTPLTFAASSNCVLYCGGTPVFADVDPKTYNIDPEDIRRKITDKTKAIIAVHLAGQPCDMDEIHKIAKEHDLIVIEDGAHALGSVYKGKKVGTLSDMTTFSFHPVKPITTGEGGMIVTDNEEFYQKMMLFRSHGITRDENLMTRNDGPWFYQQLDLGYNYRITDIQCALGCSQMKKLDRFLALRKEIVARYNEAFADCENIVTPYQLPETESGAQCLGNCGGESRCADAEAETGDQDQVQNHICDGGDDQVVERMSGIADGLKDSDENIIHDEKDRACKIDLKINR